MIQKNHYNPIIRGHTYHMYDVIGKSILDMKDQPKTPLKTRPNTILDFIKEMNEKEKKKEKK